MFFAPEVTGRGHAFSRHSLDGYNNDRARQERKRMHKTTAPCFGQKTTMTMRLDLSPRHDDKTPEGALSEPCPIDDDAANPDEENKRTGE